MSSLTQQAFWLLADAPAAMVAAADSTFFQLIIAGNVGEVTSFFFYFNFRYREFDRHKVTRCNWIFRADF